MHYDTFVPQTKITHAGDVKWIVHEVEPEDDYKLLITFITGEKKRFDCKPLLDREIYAELKNPGFFKKAHVFGDTVVWNDEIDIGPEYLYENSIAI